MRRWLKFSRLEYFSLRLTLLILVWFGLWKVISAEFPHDPPEPARQQRPQNFQKPESRPKTAEFMLL
jgi:hypothetical protein